ncbi:Gfo/Idh/MocA family oxidoreductase [Flavobacteriaceae bacterium TP-CH-4]|uniref:Gfo/Idh/MocA family oxidoreductase n=2 Tax=Pelagihabitans pacificus TaxID=2696054 RepID=A0A967AUS9_9FLAO|nr:Gfo/Idh/MocA family oxidoreductase [Pelagihabitans pacificus]
MPDNRSIGIGCIGAGFIMADCHLVAYKKADFNPVAIYSRTPSRAREVSERHDIPSVHETLEDLLNNPKVEVLDIAVPPNAQKAIIEQVVKRGTTIKGILAQKPIADTYEDAKTIVRLCQDAGIVLAVNQNMRYDQSIRACKSILEKGYLGGPVLATIDMRAIPHWLPWHESLGYLTLRNMSIHHLDTFRYWFGDPKSVYASVRPDPRTSFRHDDGICMYILEYENGLRAFSCDDVWTGPAREGAADDIYIKYRIEGLEGMAKGTIGWPSYPEPTPSTLEFTSTGIGKEWKQPKWNEVWFPDAFVGTMAQLLVALENGTEPEISGVDNLLTMALVDACYRSAREKRAVAIEEIVN